MRWLVVLLAACYAPALPTGSPCDPGPCPAGLVCSPATKTCERAAQPASGDAMPLDTVDAVVGAWLDGYVHRKQITITAGAATLDDFVVSVAFTDPDVAAAARGDGRDIVFTAADGTTILPHEVVDYASATGALDAWVQTDLPAGSTLYMYFAGPARAPSSPWSTAIFAGVWHMNGSPAMVADSLGVNHVTQATVTAQPTIVGGIAGQARSFDGVDDTMVAPDNDTLDFGTASFSFSIWVNVAQQLGAFDTPFHKGGAAAVQAGYNFQLGTGAWTSHLADGTSTQSPSFGMDGTLLGRWVQLAVVIDRDAVKDIAYANGAMTAQANLILMSMSNSLPLTFGRPMAQFLGQLDEVRVYDVALTADWIAAEYANVAARSQFLSIGPMEDR